MDKHNEVILLVLVQKIKKVTKNLSSKIIYNRLFSKIFENFDLISFKKFKKKIDVAKKK